jgi:hypothetical protein
MSTGMKFAKFAGMMVLCLGSVSSLYADSTHSQRKTKKPVPLPPLPSGPTGPVPQIPLDAIAPVPPQVSFQRGQLCIVAPNSTLGDILRAVRKQTGAEIEIPSANDRVVTNLGPGPVREVMAELLNGSRFNYVLLGSAEDSNLLTRVVLVPKAGPVGAVVDNAQAAPQPGQMQAGNVVQQQPDDAAAQDAADADVAAEDNPDENPDQSEQAEQAEQPPAPDQNGVKTPQQMLQEMQQRQLQMQQQQPGQAPLPVPGRPPQEQ